MEGFSTSDRLILTYPGKSERAVYDKETLKLLLKIKGRGWITRNYFLYYDTDRKDGGEPTTTIYKHVGLDKLYSIYQYKEKHLQI